MTRDYRKGAPPRPRRRAEPRGTCAFWFLVGGVLGGFGVGLAWMLHEPPPQAVVAEAPATAREATPKPKFDFYSLLPEEEVVVPADTPPEPVQLPPAPQPEAAAPASQPQQTPVATAAPSPAASGDYLVQVGSFRKPDDAERLRAQLAMLGIQTSIQTVTIDNGQTYHRVRTGAYDKSGANAVQSKLKQNGHDSMMMRAR